MNKLVSHNKIHKRDLADIDFKLVSVVIPDHEYGYIIFTYTAIIDNTSHELLIKRRSSCLFEYPYYHEEHVTLDESCWKFYCSTTLTDEAGKPVSICDDSGVLDTSKVSKPLAKLLGRIGAFSPNHRLCFHMFLEKVNRYICSRIADYTIQVALSRNIKSIDEYNTFADFKHLITKPAEIAYNNEPSFYLLFSKEFDHGAVFEVAKLYLYDCLEHFYNSIIKDMTQNKDAYLKAAKDKMGWHPREEYIEDDEY